MSAVCHLMPGRLKTYRVVVADDLVLGWIRLDVTAREWIARTRGSERSAASLRRFCDKSAAISWLMEREPDPRPPRKKRTAVA